MKLALCVGINDYPGSGSDLAGCANDCYDWADVLAMNTLAPNATYRDWLNAIRMYLPSQDLPQTPQLYGTSTMKRWPVL